MHLQQDNSTHLVIMAGGSGQRFWPLSTKKLPKQFHDFLDTGKTLLQATVERFRVVIPQDRIWVVTHVDYVSIVKKQLPWINEQQILGEPIPKNTAPCIAYACSKISRLNPEATLVVTPADHHIQNEALFIQTIQQALHSSISSYSITLLGMLPKSPETGYGYIAYNPEQKGPVKEVIGFVEKPPRSQAQQYIQQGNYVWNTGVFIGKIGAFIKNFQTYLPDVWDTFVYQDNCSSLNKSKAKTSLANLYKLLPSISFDQGILEKAKELYVICQDFGWTDLGTWQALYQHVAKDKQGNACQGQVVTLATKNCFIKGNNQQLIAAYGLDNLVIVQHNEVLVICPQDEVQNLKQLVSKLEEEGYEKYV